MPNPNDEVRRQLLRYFYDRAQRATSHTGKKGTAVKIGDIKSELKGLHGLTQPQVMANLEYLLDMKWIKSIKIQKQFETKRGTTIPSSVEWFEITAAGTDKMEGESEFTRFAGVNVNAVGTNVITLGDGNLVNVDHRELHAELNELRDRIAASDDLSEDERLDVVTDIETLKDQLAKARPNPTVVGLLWSGIEKAAAVAGVAEFALTVAPHVQHLIR